MKVVLILALLAYVVLASVRDCNVQVSNNRIVATNGYVRVEFNLDHPQIDVVAADFQGNGKYGGNLMAHGSLEDQKLFRYGIVLEHDLLGTGIETHASSKARSPTMQTKIITNTTTTVKYQIVNVRDDAQKAVVTSDWTITINAGQRYFTLNVTASALVFSARTINVRLSQYFSPTSSLGQFDRGVQQMMNSTQHFFATREKLQQYYALGATGCITTTGQTTEKVLLSSTYRDQFFRSGIHHLLFGKFPSKANKWSDLEKAKLTPLGPGLNATISQTILVNNFDFPVVYPYESDDNDVDMPIEHIRAFHTGVHASPVSALVSFDVPEGVISPTVATPGRAYWPLFNFYDPDSWMSNSAMVYAADPYLFNETRKMLDTSIRYVLPSGQLPHHFIGPGPSIKPTYEAISGATQTGPNIFWTLAALQYVKASGDYSWLQKNIKGIENVVGFITDRYSPSFQLLNAPGPLQIDVFIRNNYTSDTNAMMTYLLNEMADAQDLLKNKDLAIKYRDMSKNITQGMNKWLWSNDHYITQINDDKSTRDFIDYDANLLAVAFNLQTPDRSQAIMKRILSGKCTNADVAGGKPRAAYVSEKYYDSDNCYGGNIGDSEVTMGRIAWAEAHAMKQTNNVAGLYDLVLNPLLGELLQNTWLYERYTCNSEPTHNPFYIEYPELVVMLLREVVYGINIGLTKVKIEPNLPKDKPSYKYRIGRVSVDYAQDRVAITAPGSGDKNYTIAGMVQNATYHLSFLQKGIVERDQDIKSDANGVLNFVAPLGSDHVISVDLVKH
jgi:hypothetical protein